MSVTKPTYSEAATCSVHGKAPGTEDLVENGGGRSRLGHQEIEIGVTRVVLVVVDGDHGGALSEELAPAASERGAVEHVDGGLRADDRCLPADHPVRGAARTRIRPGKGRRPERRPRRARPRHSHMRAKAERQPRASPSGDSWETIRTCVSWRRRSATSAAVTLSPATWLSLVLVGGVLAGFRPAVPTSPSSGFLLVRSRQVGGSARFEEGLDAHPLVDAHVVDELQSGCPSGLQLVAYQALQIGPGGAQAFQGGVLLRLFPVDRDEDLGVTPDREWCRRRSR